MSAYKDRHSLDTLDYILGEYRLYTPTPFTDPCAPLYTLQGLQLATIYLDFDKGQPVSTDTLVTRVSARSYTFTVADRDREAALGQKIILRVAFKLLDWVDWSEANDIDTSRLYRVVDTKVWKFVTEPEHELVNPDEVHQGLKHTYPEGFPESWKGTDVAKETLEAFRQYAAFWFFSVYDRSKGPRLAVHREELPADFPNNEFDAFIQVAKIFSSGPNTRGSSASISPQRANTVREPAESPDPSRMNIEAMTTKFPARIRADRLVGFDGKPQRIFSLDLSVEDMCGEHNYPGYYGGTVTGSAEIGYKYVKHDDPDGASNYQFGSRICSAITSRFVDDAAVWWEDYRHAGGEKPNCWKTSSGCGVANSCPPGFLEISLFDILTRDFPAENDVTEAKLELSRLKWDASASDVMRPFATFRNKSTALAKRAGYISWDQQCPVIRECIEPYSLRKAVQIYDSPDTFWFHTRANVNTWLREHENIQAHKPKCGTCGGSHDSSNCKKPANLSYPRLTSNAPRSAVCDWCSIKGHYKSECLRLKNQISRGEVPADERNKRGGPPKAPPVQPAAPQVRFPPRTGLPRPANAGGSRPFNCRNCGGAGHAAAVCPSAKKAAVAATNLVDDNARDSDEDDMAQYVMNTWVPRRNIVNPGVSGRPKHVASAVSQYEGIDELFSTVVANRSIDFPLFNNITTPIDKVDVMDNVVSKVAKPPNLVKVSDALDMSILGPPAAAVDVPSGPVWTIASTMRGQDLLTIFDTGAVKAAIPLSTANGSRTAWTTVLPHELYFIKADGTRYQPAGSDLLTSR
ncbi:hypothetical protein EDC01DRAFT_637068 [Geopyxis carbonaria]|nr:hypothetical protein EDC01DRAFT_637068 [Geopyxis carbonaria]